jgi:hypothetical protein
VVVLAGKVFQCIKREKSINAVLTGDKTELLSDNLELEQYFVLTYSSFLRKQFSMLGAKLLNTLDIDEYNVKSQELVAQMKRKQLCVSLRSLGMALQTLNDVVTSGILHKETEIQEDLKSGLKAVSSALRRLDEEEIVESLLDSADVVFCTLS